MVRMIVVVATVRVMIDGDSVGVVKIFVCVL